MEAVEVALDAAMQVMQNGGSTIAADRTFSNVLTGFKKEGALAVWRLDFIALSADAGADSSAVVRPVGPIGSNLARASQAMHLAERLVGGNISTSEFSVELERIKKLGSPYNRWLMIAAAACVSGFLSRIAGGDWGSFGIAVMAAAAGQFLRSLLPRAAVVAAVLVTGLLTYHEHTSAQRQELVQGVKVVAGVSSLPSPEILQDFDTIQQMSTTPGPDQELIALMK